ncbi:hypothetical protein AB833_27510 [Chromatiales bacterium (ex Bugula neritina AB1)]|nr:hypothetical protein AB833_27510 [Chromatiales bacterium (ex Bugula neritina AB1)]
MTAIDPAVTGGLYAIDKLQAHLANVRHLAISIFVVSGSSLLIQRRASTKYHSANLWANTVCSHPRWQETPEHCAQRRLQEELGWTVPLKPFGQIDYAAQVGELYENEQVHCFWGRFDESIDTANFNTREVGAVNWLTIPEILQQMDQQPQTFTEWFKIYMTNHHEMISTALQQPG